jgi:DNA-binding transcriptional regulator YhcF (GntR family)
MEKEKIKNKFEDCFKNCALARIQLKKCIINAMDAGLNKPEILAISNEIPASVEPSDASLCSIIAVGQVLKYEKKHTKTKKSILKDNVKKDIEKKLRECFKKCGLAKKQLRKCVGNAIDAGLTKNEVLAVTDDIVGGLGEKQVSLCAIVAVEQALRYEETSRAKPLDIVKERSLERGDS